MPPRSSTIKQIRIAIFAQWQLPEADGVAPGTSTSNGPQLPEVLVVIIESQPIDWRPVIGGRATKDRPRQEANHCFLLLANLGGLKVLPVVTNGFLPSLAMPPTPHMAPPWFI